VKRLHASSALCIAFLALAAASPTSAFAADETAKARTTFQEGVQLEAAGNYATALGKFQEVAAIKRTPAVVFHIAFCQEKLGHLVEALGGYRIAEHDADGDPKSAKVQQTAAEAIAALEKRVPSLTVKRGKNADLAKISIDGVELGNNSLDKPQQVDPGSHSIDATAPGVEPFHQVIKIAEGETKSVDVTFKDKPVAGPKPPAGDDKPKKDDDKPPAEGQSSVVPYVVGGVGVASLLLSGVFFLQEKSAENDLNSQCKGNICPSSASSTGDKGKSMALLGNITFGLGIVGVGVGTYLLVTQKPSADPAAAAVVRKPSYDVRISPTNGGMGASLVGSF
jgi:hypothetical protein